MKMQVNLTVDVDWCDEDLGTPAKGDPLRYRLEGSIAQAVADALWRQRDAGFNHDMDDQVTILCDYPVRAKIVD